MQNSKTKEQLDLQFRKPVLEYLKYLITRLECYQLAESVIQITAKRTIPHKISHTKKPNRSLNGLTNNKIERENTEYLIEFDKSTGLKPMWLDFESLEKLSKMREELIPQFSPAWTATDIKQTQPSRGVSTIDIGKTPSRRSKSMKKGQKLGIELRIQPRADSLAKIHKNGKIIKSSTKPVKQLWSLLDESTIGRRINFETHGLCHNCKRIKQISTDLIKCKYNATKCGLIVPSAITINGCSLYNGIFYSSKIKSGCEYKIFI